MSTTPDLGPLPEPEAWNTQVGPWGDRSTDYAYTMRQMQAERQRCYMLGVAAASQWRPIETVPKEDQFRAIVAYPLDAGGHYVEEAWWDGTRDEWWPANTDHTDSFGNQVYPTHWMPLPAAPSEPTKEGG